MLQHGYHWIQYISFEHEIEARKSEYYRVLRACQALRPGEPIDAWVGFYLDALITLCTKLNAKLETDGVDQGLSPRERSILVFIEDHPGSRSGEIAERLGIPSPTVKRILTDLMSQGLIERFGAGPGTNYSVA